MKYRAYLRESGIMSDDAWKAIRKNEVPLPDED